jgi:hypothetical protein
VSVASSESRQAEADEQTNGRRGGSRFTTGGNGAVPVTTHDPKFASDGGLVAQRNTRRTRHFSGAGSALAPPTSGSSVAARRPGSCTGG